MNAFIHWTYASSVRMLQFKYRISSRTLSNRRTERKAGIGAARRAGGREMPTFTIGYDCVYKQYSRGKAEGKRTFASSRGQDRAHLAQISSNTALDIKLGVEGTMARVPFPRNNLDPRRANSFLDSCAFDPKYAPEDQSAKEIRAIGDQGRVGLLLTHSNQKELEHPNTPEDVSREARAMIFTIETDLTPDERRRRTEIHRVLTGNGKPEKYEADARHVFEAGKYIGYLITTDQRILDKRGELSAVCAATIVTPSEWLAIYHTAHA